ncbi:MAG: hypothetical protein CSA89_00420 [Bacteroidales bacterium]|nr:MAG: hypothetical protein CSA89_00420 [Bacteroidales bacterium]
MNKHSILFLAIMFLVACGSKTTQKATSDNNTSENITSSGTSMSIAVINSDSILEKYIFAIQAREKMIDKVENARATLNGKMKTLQKEMTDFQKKIENNAFLSRERAEQEAMRLQKKQEDLQMHGQKLEQEFMEEQQKLSIQLKDSINMAIGVINKDKKYSLILSTSSLTDNVLFAEKSLSITGEVLEFLNARIDK